MAYLNTHPHRQNETAIVEKKEGGQGDEDTESKLDVTIGGKSSPPLAQAQSESLESRKKVVVGTNAMADVTISNVETGEKTPALPQFISPPTFKPCTDSAPVFIAAYERTAVANN